MKNIMGVSFSDEEIKEFQKKFKTFDSLKWLYEKNRNHQEISDKEAEKEFGRFGLYMLRVLALMGYLDTCVGPNTNFKQNKLSLRDRIKNFTLKIKEFCR